MCYVWAKNKDKFSSNVSISSPQSTGFNRPSFCSCTHLKTTFLAPDSKYSYKMILVYLLLLEPFAETASSVWFLFEFHGPGFSSSGLLLIVEHA